MTLSEFKSFGQLVLESTEEALTISSARHTFRACAVHKSFEFVEIRRFLKEGTLVAEMLVVDCVNDGVPTKNTVGILYRERIGLIFYVESSRMPEVRALRQNFPLTLHQYYVKSGEPAALCLYLETWETVERSWTPRSHLNRVLWWLAKTAAGVIHNDDQPVEPFYLPGYYEIVLPPDFREKVHHQELVLTIERIGERKFIGRFEELSKLRKDKIDLNCIVISTKSVNHAPIEHLPPNLGTLDEQILRRGGDGLFSPLCLEIVRLVNAEGFPKLTNSKLLIVVQIPIRQNDSTLAERYEHKAFYLNVSLGQLGEDCNVLADGKDGNYYKIPSFSDEIITSAGKWHSIEIEAMEIAFSLTSETAQEASGISADGSNFFGVLAGVGALGSAIAEIWYREAWGQWTFIDPDYVKAHNLARSSVKNFQIGCPKAIAVKQMVEETYFDSYAKAFAIVDSVINFSNDEVKTATKNAELVVDITTTLAVPRELAIADVKRSASAFITPSGHGAVLMLEDADRDIRLDALEAQYYSAILNSNWGEEHLAGVQGSIRVGAGCRDLSAIISVELIQLHAAILARQIRLGREHSEALISVWQVDPKSGAVSVHAPSVSESLTVIAGDWKIVWNTQLKNKVGQFRSTHLPNETGGIVLGYVDQKLRSIFVVDLLSGPPDSMEAPDGFIRGVQGLEEQIRTTQVRTANIVSYIGEWHSHPPGTSTDLSTQDVQLLAYLVEMLKQDGIPVVMLIVGENEETWAVD
jgi:hypothetical protein